MNRDVHDMRQDYDQFSLTEDMVADNPAEQFDRWFKDAQKADDIIEPNAMAIATVDSAGQPAVRMVLMKSYSIDGIVWYTNYQSRKAHNIEANSKVALLFYWESLQRQVRIEGTIEKVSAATSDAYFNERPYGSRIGAIASPQSTVIENREMLEQRVANLQQQYKEDEPVPRPDHWGGYLVKPHYFEFWQGRSSRLHDRLAFKKQADGTWSMNRLAP